jgi:hypothetical protein
LLVFVAFTPTRGARPLFGVCVVIRMLELRAKAKSDEEADEQHCY